MHNGIKWMFEKNHLGRDRCNQNSIVFQNQYLVIRFQVEKDLREHYFFALSASAFIVRIASFSFGVGIFPTFFLRSLSTFLMNFFDAFFPNLGVDEIGKAIFYSFRIFYSVSRIITQHV